ncbi:GLPGLI family protein [Sphingobacterium deserti]|uniref:GLPGLI family protein n=1 Tax=Sphingobacterium deserti TaxID=1229276 RepID=A0A0B8T7P6_9SPHI|nr:GLPGLI family protein [Sphingobacterium deserti]KGE14559.1 hypothetical protein DI53_1588 [Sphingobacterium deserti]
MRNFYLYSLIAFLSFFLRLSAQTFADATFKCTYKLTYIGNPENDARRTSDFMVLEFGPSSSVFYSYNTFRVDSALQADIDKGISSTQILAEKAKYGKRGMLYHIFKDANSKKITVTEKIVTDHYLYQEPLHTQKWSIQTDKDSILGYVVQKAVCSFGGREFEAWFTPEIAIDNGPWKFGGLPGLILKVEDSKKHFSFELTGFQKMVNPAPVAIVPQKYIKLSKADFLKLQERYIKRPHDFIKNQMSIEVKPMNDAARESAKRVRPYNPIEWN